MVGGLNGFQATDSKCQGVGMPQRRHQGVCMYVRASVCVWLAKTIPKILRRFSASTVRWTWIRQTKRVRVKSCALVQSLSEYKYINAAFHLMVLTVLNVSDSEWRLHFSLPLYTRVTRFSGLKTLFSRSPPSLSVSPLQVPISPIPELFHEQSLRGRVVTQACALLSPFFSLSFHLFKHSGGKGFGEMETTTW